MVMVMVMVMVMLPGMYLILLGSVTIKPSFKNFSDWYLYKVVNMLR
jgi:hypothetical protein